MLFRTAFSSLAALLLALAPPAPAHAQDRVERLFYYVDREDSWNSFRAHVGSITIVAPSGYFIDEDGVVYGDIDPRVTALAQEHGVAVVPLLVNRGFVQDELTRFLADDAARARTVAALVELCRRHDYAGIQVDIENLSIHDRDAFTRFYGELARALHAGGRTISVAVVHRPDELAGATAYHEWLMDSWRGGYDLKALAELGDFISVMTYSQHTRRTPPGPQASVPWVEDNIGYFLRFVPPEKLSLGIPLGSQRWYTSYEERIQPELARSYSAQVSHAWAMHLIERNDARPIWDETHQVAYSYFPVGGTFEWIFLEDARSFAAKLALVRGHGLRGFSAWVLGPEDPEIWRVLDGPAGTR